MRIVVIGASGHIGTYLIPLLAEGAHEVIAISRGQHAPYIPHAAWKSVKQVKADREAKERDGTFGRRLRELAPDVVIDLICFEPESAEQAVDALRGRVQHYLCCSSLWVYGWNTEVPVTEDAPRRPRSRCVDTRRQRRDGSGSRRICVLSPGTNSRRANPKRTRL